MAYDPEDAADVKILDDAVTAAVAKAVDPLKAKNEELIGEKRGMQTVLKDFDALKLKFEGHEELQQNYDNIMSQLGEEEDAELIKQGRITEVIARRNERFVTENKGMLTAAEEAKAKAEKERDDMNSVHRTYVIKDRIRTAAIESKIQSHALDDVIRAGIDGFTLEENGDVVQRKDGEIVLIDNKIVTPLDWINNRKADSPHWWPASSSSSMTGGPGGGFNDDGDVSTQLTNAVASGNMKQYRELRGKTRQASSQPSTGGAPGGQQGRGPAAGGQP